MSWTKSKADVFPLEKRIEIIDEGILPEQVRVEKPGVVS